MSEKLLRLFNTMNRIEVRGESVLILADCLRFVDQLVQECANEAGKVTEDN